MAYPRIISKDIDYELNKGIKYFLRHPVSSLDIKEGLNMFQSVYFPRHFMIREVHGREL